MGQSSTEQNAKRLEFRNAREFGSPPTLAASAAPMPPSVLSPTGKARSASLPHRQARSRVGDDPRPAGESAEVRTLPQNQWQEHRKGIKLQCPNITGEATPLLAAHRPLEAALVRRWATGICAAVDGWGVLL